MKVTLVILLTWASYQVNQSQSNGSVSYFEAPVPIQIFGTGGETLDLQLNNTFDGETFLETVAFEVAGVLFDPEFDIISKNNTVVLGVDQFLLENQFIIFPNPIKTVLHIKKPDQLSINSIEIFDALGRSVLKTSYQNSIAVNSLSTGIHFVKFTTSNGVFYKQIIKE